MTQCTSQYLSSCPLRTERALPLFFLAVLVSAHRLGFKIQLCGWKIERMTLQAPTENVEEPACIRNVSDKRHLQSEPYC